MYVFLKVLLNDEIYKFGGIELEKKLYKLDSQQMEWIKFAEMNEDRRCISNSSLVFQGCICVFGWNNNRKAALNTVEKYCPERNEWIEMPGMNEKRDNAAFCNEKIFVSTSKVWTPIVDMPGIRYGHSMISDGSSVFVMGGFDGASCFKTVWRICPSEEDAIWEELQPMNESRRSFTAKSLCCSTPGYKKEIYAIGGWNDKKTLDSVEIFDGKTWREGPKLPNGCNLMSSCVILSSLAETLLQF